MSGGSRDRATVEKRLKLRKKPRLQAEFSWTSQNCGRGLEHPLNNTSLGGSRVDSEWVKAGLGVRDWGV